MDNCDITIEDDSQISPADIAERAIDLEESRGDFAIDHAFFSYMKQYDHHFELLQQAHRPLAVHPKQHACNSVRIVDHHHVHRQRELNLDVLAHKLGFHFAILAHE